MTIPFETWLPQIVGYCELILDKNKLESSWIEHDSSITSAVDFDEMYEQIFGDLDADTVMTNASAYPPEMLVGMPLIIKFLDGMRRLNLERAVHSNLHDPRQLFVSELWTKIQGDASEVVLFFRSYSVVSF